ncbi:MAG: branched-chain amino acid ABC transporter permease, partial [Streptomyces sp.]|nr:branched-chain amino acid ABC transporter permease [Streptomyces sp.]
MTTQTTQSPSAPANKDGATKGLIGLPENVGRALATIGGALAVVSTFLAWTWTNEFPGKLTIYGYPGGLQVLVL